MVLKLPEVKVLERMLEVAQRYTFLWEEGFAKGNGFEICFKSETEDWSEETFYRTLGILQDEKKQFCFYEGYHLNSMDKALKLTSAEVYTREILSGNFNFEAIKKGFEGKLTEKLTAYYLKPAKNEVEKRVNDEVSKLGEEIQLVLLRQEKHLNFHKKAYSDLLTKILGFLTDNHDLLPESSRLYKDSFMDFYIANKRYIVGFFREKNRLGYTLHLDGISGSCSTEVLTDILIRCKNPNDVASVFIEKMRHAFRGYYGTRAEKDGTIDKKMKELQGRLELA